MVESVSGRFSVRLNRVHGISRFPCLAGRPCLLRRGLVAATLCAAMGAGATAVAGQQGGQPTMTLSQQAGQQVVLLGRESKIPWQHLIDPGRGSDAVYVDLDGGGQIVAYVSGGLDCPGSVWLVGTVIAVEGGSKRPGDAATFREHQLVATAWGGQRWMEGTDLLNRLANPDLAPEGRRALADRVVAAGLDAVPVLIAHLGDDRPAMREERILNEGELMNAPPHVPAPAPEYATVTVSLGRSCEELLYAIVTPSGYRSPFMANFKPRSVGAGARMFRVAHWPAWWGRNHARSLADIHRSLQPVIDRYWQSRGEEQVVH